MYMPRMFGRPWFACGRALLIHGTLEDNDELTDEEVVCDESKLPFMRRKSKRTFGSEQQCYLFDLGRMGGERGIK